MDLKELEYVVTVADEGSISRAAEKLFMAQSSLSQYVQRYEAELGTRLFARTGHGVRPTASGEIFIRNARQMLQQYQRVKSELLETEQPKSGRISFGISSFRGTALIPPVLCRFRAEYPGVDVLIFEHDSQVLQKKIAAGELDMALVALRPEQVLPEHITVLQDEVCLVANRDHPVMAHAHLNYPHRPWINLKDTAEYEYLLSNRNTVLGRIAQEQFEACAIAPRAVNTNLTAAFAAEMACQGLGLAFTYGSCAKKRVNVEYLSLGKERYFVDLVLIFPPDGYRSRSIRRLEKMIKDFYMLERTNLTVNL